MCGLARSRASIHSPVPDADVRRRSPRPRGRAGSAPARPSAWPSATARATRSLDRRATHARSSGPSASVSPWKATGAPHRAPARRSRGPCSSAAQRSPARGRAAPTTATPQPPSSSRSGAPSSAELEARRRRSRPAAARSSTRGVARRRAASAAERSARPGRRARRRRSTSTRGARRATIARCSRCRASRRRGGSVAPARRHPALAARAVRPGEEHQVARAVPRVGLRRDRARPGRRAGTSPSSIHGGSAARPPRARRPSRASRREPTRRATRASWRPRQRLRDAQLERGARGSTTAR